MFVDRQRERDDLCYVFFFVQSKGFPVCEREKQHDFLDVFVCSVFPTSGTVNNFPNFEKSSRY